MYGGLGASNWSVTLGERAHVSRVFISAGASKGQLLVWLSV